MYLPDHQLAKRLHEFAFEAEPGMDEFDPDAQIGAASIDLRISPVYWKPRNSLRFRPGGTIDLTQIATREVNPTRGWRQVKLGEGETLSLKPGEFALCRTTERFHVPRDCAAAIEGRSSFARMGLSVHCSGGFINPGWAGRMPLTLHNQGPYTIKIPAGLPICQVMFVKLESEVEKDYSQRDGQKYLDDYGGPSYWWRDAVIRKIIGSGNGALSDRVLRQLDGVLDGVPVSDDALQRFEDFVGRRRVKHLSNSDDLLEKFAAREDLYFHGDRFARWSTPVITAAFIGLAVKGFSAGVSVGDLVLTALSLISLGVTGYLHLRSRLVYLTTHVLRKHQV